MKDLARTVAEGYRTLSERGQRTLVLFVIATLAIAALDGVALVLLARIISDATSLDLPVSSGLGIPLATVVILFSVKSTLSALAGYVTTTRMAEEELQFGQEQVEHYLDEPWASARSRSPADLIRSVDQGPNALVQNLLVAAASLGAELANATVIAVVLLVVNPVIAVTTATFFIVSVSIQHRWLSRRASRSGEIVARSMRDLYSDLTDLNMLRKSLAVNRSATLLDHLGALRSLAARHRALTAFFPTVPRFALELTLSLGIALIGLISFLREGEIGAISAVVLFTAAGFRLLPVVNRVQALVVSMLSFLPIARSALLQDDFADGRLSPLTTSDTQLIRISNANFRFPDSTSYALDGISIDIHAGMHYAILGRSGSGKSTLVDLCLGLLSPTSGTVEHIPHLRVAFVPQDTYIARLPLIENVALEWDADAVDHNRVRRALERVGLRDLSDERTESLSSQSLSGGQKQRIGIARALYREPNVLFLDEVTSSLDAESEQVIVSLLDSLKPSTTIVTIAHRLTTVQHADIVIYMEAGRIVGQGTFAELNKLIPRLRQQIELGEFNLSL